MKLTDLQEKWLQALESGRYEQGESNLCYDNKFCCLGVACEVAGIRKQNLDGWVSYGVENRAAFAPAELVEALHLRDDSGRLHTPIQHKVRPLDSLTQMNDSGMTFLEIAAYIRNRPENVFWSES